MKVKQIYKIDGDVVSKAEFERRSRVTEGVSTFRSTAKWPIQCVSMGGTVADIPKLQEALARAGVTAEISRDGDPIAKSQKHQNAIAKALGFRNKDRYY